MSTVWVKIATLGPIGRLPAPGTMASCCMVPLVLLLRAKVSFMLYFLCIFALVILGFICIKRSLCFFKEKDPSSIVIDECVGCLLALALVPVTIINIMTGLFIFRFFDITKCLGIKYCEHISGPWGILTDDMLAGIMTMCVMQMIYLVQTRYV